MAEKLTELDTTKLTTPIKNWIGRKGNAALAGFGKSGRAASRHEKRLIANKLYKVWQRYLVSRRRAGTPADMNGFVGQYFPQLRDELSRELPAIFPPGTSPAGGGGSPGAGPSGVGPSGSPGPAGGSSFFTGPTRGQSQATQGAQAPPPPSGQSPATQQPLAGAQTTQATTTQAPQANQQNNLADMQRYQAYQKRFGRLLGTAQPDKQRILRTTMSMLRDFSGRSETAKSWVRNYIERNLKPYASIIPELGQLGSDPFANAPQRRARPGATPATPQATPAAPPPAATQPASSTQATAPAPPAQQTTAAQPSSDLNIPTPPRGFRPDMRRPPEFLRRQRNEGQTANSRKVLTEAPGDLGIPQPPPGTPQRMYRSKPNMAQPPAFLQRQRNQPPPAPAQAAQPLAQPAPRQPVQRQPTQQPAQPTRPQQSQKPLTRAMQDRVMVALAGILMDTGMAGATSTPQTGQTSQTMASPQQSSSGRAPVNPQTLAAAMRNRGVNGETIGYVNDILQQNPNLSGMQIAQMLHDKGVSVDAALFIALTQAAH